MKTSRSRSTKSPSFEVVCRECKTPMGTMSSQRHATLATELGYDLCVVCQDKQSRARQPGCVQGELP